MAQALPVDEDLTGTWLCASLPPSSFIGCPVPSLALCCSAVAQTFFVDEDLKESLRLDAILTVVDAKHTLMHLEEEKPDGVVNEAVQQVGQCALASWRAVVTRFLRLPSRGAWRMEEGGGTLFTWIDALCWRVGEWGLEKPGGGGVARGDSFRGGQVREDTYVFAVG